MIDPGILLDLVIAGLILFLAVKTLTAPLLYQSAILFIAFGLTMALAWSRLAAPDVALAEAAIGTGLLGVLLIDSLRFFTGKSSFDGSRQSPKDPPAESPPPSKPVVFSLILAGAAFTACLLAAIVNLPETTGLAGRVARDLPGSGVEHPVTAVLLNFRGFDTWLEVGVLLVAMLGIFCVGGFVGFRHQSSPDDPGELFQWLVRGFAPFILLVAFYLLWLGKYASGGAFQSGVVLGAGMIFLRLTGVALISRLPVYLWKTGLLFGFGFFLVFGLIIAGRGSAFLEYPPEHASTLILLLEGAATISIGFTLACYFEYLNFDTPSSQPVEKVDEPVGEESVPR